MAPAWYLPVIPTVRAVEFSDAREADRLLAWLDRLSQAAVLVGQQSAQGLVVRESVDGSQRVTLVRVGDVAVEMPGSRFGWDACPGRSFRRRFALRPRELPVFASDDAAE